MPNFNLPHFGTPTTKLSQTGSLKGASGSKGAAQNGQEKAEAKAAAKEQIASFSNAQNVIDSAAGIGGGGPAGLEGLGGGPRGGPDGAQNVGALVGIRIGGNIIPV